MIVIRITMTVMPEKHLELTQTLLSMNRQTEKEKGCLSYAVFCSIEDKNSFILLQEWKTREDLDHYIRSLQFGVLLGTQILLVETPEIQIYTVSNSEGMEAIHEIRSQKP
jgi:quinol monooxygenase YgiN